MRILTDFTGNAIYLDTMLPYIFLRSADPAAKDFFKRIESGEFLAYTSVLTFDELAYRLLLAFIKDNYVGSPLEHYRNDEIKIMAEFAPRVTSMLRRLCSFPNLVVLDIAVSDLDTMNNAMLQYKLRPRDALHFAAMQRGGCLDLASNDADFDRIRHIRRFLL